MLVNTVLEGDCLEVMKTLPINCIDTILTDPPYGLEFMGKNWDYGIPGIAYWREALRVAKPGATLMAFGGSRTHHRLMVAIEDAGWEIRDCITYFHDGSQQEAAFMASLSKEQMAAYLELHSPNNNLYWCYGSGFPKSLDIGKALDKQAIIDCPVCNGKISYPVYRAICPTHGEIEPKLVPPERYYCSLCDERLDDTVWIIDEPCGNCAGTGKVKGAEREVVDNRGIANGRNINNHNSLVGKVTKFQSSWSNNITAPATPQAKEWDGWHSHGIKPAFEPIIIAMKPNEGSYADNALKWGVSGLWIDGARVETNGESLRGGMNSENYKHSVHEGYDRPWRHNQITRNMAKERSDANQNKAEKLGRFPANIIHDGSDEVEAEFAKAGVRTSGARNGVKKARSSFGGGAFVEKARDTGKYTDASEGSASRFFYTAKASPSERGSYNNHPTVKPLALLKYLARLTKTPTGGVILDPFAGSGTTALAAIAEGRDYILIEKEPEYVAICNRRIAEYTGQEIEVKEIEIAEETVKQLGLW